MYKQLKTPNLDPVIYVNGVALKDWYGLCLLYVRTAFGTGWAGATAHEGWNLTKLKHADRNLPTGVYVPIWFDHFGTYGGVYKNWGHVAIYKDGKIWSSPFTHKPYADTFTSIAAVESKYGAKYIGWSEDLNGTKVIESIGDDMALTRDLIVQEYIVNRGAAPSEAEIAAHLNGGTLQSLSLGFKAENDATRAFNAKTIADLQTALKNEQNKPPREIVKEVEKIVTQYVEKPVDEKAVVESWLARLWNNLFKK